MSRRININYSEIEEKILFLWNGKVLIKADVSDSNYKKILKLKKSIFREENMTHCIQIYFPQGIGKINVIIFQILYLII